jgi:hypothetical protein
MHGQTRSAVLRVIGALGGSGGVVRGAAISGGIARATADE